ncbi:MAG: hypothetical protein Q9193_005811 [Seirophora villosa]
MSSQPREPYTPNQFSLPSFDELVSSIPSISPRQLLSPSETPLATSPKLLPPFRKVSLGTDHQLLPESTTSGRLPSYLGSSKEYSKLEGPPSKDPTAPQGFSRTGDPLLSPFVPKPINGHGYGATDGSAPCRSIPLDGPKGPKGVKDLSRTSDSQPPALPLSQRPSTKPWPLMTNPTLVRRTPQTLADNPGAAMFMMGEQASKNDFSPDCQVFRSAPSNFLQRHPFFDDVFASAVIFSHFNPLPFLANGGGPTKDQDLEPRILMLQRSADDSDAPNGFELPGGTVKSCEASIFHSLAREIWFYTNLNISSVNRQVQKGTVHTKHSKLRDGTSRSENRLHVFFDVDCLEVQRLSTPEAFQDMGNFHDFLNAIPVRISNSHRSWSWMTEAGIKYMLAGKVEGAFVSLEEGQKALEAFAQREGRGQPLTRPRKGPDPGKRRREAEDQVNEERYKAEIAPSPEEAQPNVEHDGRKRRRRRPRDELLRRALDQER